MTSVTLSLSKIFRYLCLISLAIGCLAAYAGLTSSAKNSVMKLVTPPVLAQTNEILRLQFDNSPNGDAGEIPTTADLNGSNPKSLAYPTGIVNQGVYLGRNERLYYASEGNITDLEGSIELWIKPNWNGTDTTTRNILRYGATGGILLYKEGTNLKISLNRNSENGSNEIDAQSGIESWGVDEWHHIAATWSSTGKFIRLYIDGSLASDRNFTGNLPTINQATNNRFQLGADGIRFPLEAIVDEVKISDAARTSQEIATRMISGITVVSAALVDVATLQPAPTTIELYPGWSYWKDLRFNATTNVGILKLPVLIATWSTSNAHIAEMDVVTGRIKAKDAASDTAPATGIVTITTAFNTSQISIAINVRSAAKPSDPEPIGSDLAIPATGYINKIPVAIVRYLPAANDTILDSAIAGSNTALTTVKANLYSVERNLKFMMENGSRFRAYITPASTPSLGYEVVKIINIYEPIPNGIKGSTSGTYYPDYKQILARIKAEDLVKTQNVKEFWIESYSYNSTVFEKPLVEDANMSSQLTGDVTNNPRRNDDLPIYDKSYTIYGIDLAKPFNLAARTHASQLEALFTYANKNHDGDTTMFVRSFVGFDETGVLPNGTHNYGRVGKATRPPNTAMELNFDGASGQSDIKDWNAIDPPQSTLLIDSTEWSGLNFGWNGIPPDTTTKAETNWYIYWMQSIPGLNNAVFHENTDLMNNWWRIVGDWDGAKISKLGLYTPATCNYTLGASTQTVTLAAGQGSFTVTTTAGCRWTAATTATWIHTTSSGTGTGTLNFTFDANAGGARTGTITVEGRTFTLNQDGIPCTYTITPELPITIAAASNTGTISVTSPTGCAWTAVSNSPAFISITAGASGSGNGTVSYSVLANTGVARTGTITIAGKTFTINQDAQICTYTTSPTNDVPITITAAANTGTINVTSPTGCAWTAISNAAFISITAGASGTGNGTVNYSVLANTGATRTGTITVAGKTFTINQGTGCNYLVSPLSQNFVAGGGAAVIAITAGTGCTWAAISNDNWITINVGSSSGTGSGAVNFTVAANTGANRSGTMTVAGQTFTITQDAPQAICITQRTLPAEYTNGQALQVSVQVSPPVNTQSHAVEETPPTGWTVSGIDNGGQFDAVNGKVKWGPFFDATARTLNYSVTPPAGTTGQKTFSGTVSINGTNNAICGTATIVAASLIHPSDLNNNLRIEINELTSYGAAWKAGTSWSRPPNPIDINYVTNAGLIWKLGEVYHYDASRTPPFVAGASISMLQPNEAMPLKMLQALGYMPGLGFGTGAATETAFAANPAAFVSGTAVASFNAANYTPGVGITVTISVTPDASTNVYAVEDTVPAGWVVSGINNSGAFDSNNHKVKWGPYFDNTARSLTYVVTPPTGETGNKTFIGSVSFDGISVSVAGTRSLSPPVACTYSLGAANQSFAAGGGVGSFTVIAPAGCAWNATPNDIWITVTQGSGNGNGAVNFSVAANTGIARSGTMTAGGQTFTINQGAGCSYMLNPVSQNFGAGGGTGTIAITAGTGCPWTAVPSTAWLTVTSANTGSGSGSVSFTVAASDGTARTGNISLGGQVFAVAQAANTAPTITAATGISATQNVVATSLTIATVSDTETPAANLTVTAMTIPAGITIGTITNTNGTISAPVSASCGATVGNNSITLKVTDGHGISVMTSLSINVINSPDCNPSPVDTSAGDHKIGSILIYNYYTSDVSQPASKNTQIKLTNTSDTAEVTVRMSLIDGQTGNISIVFFCLAANQTINFLASEYDPSVTGYIIAVAVDKITGCPVKANVLMGGAYVKLPTGHSANLSAVAVSAIAATPATCTVGGTTATINFDGVAYSRLPRLLAIDNLSSLKDGNNSILVLNRVGGNLISSAPSIGAVSGKIYDAGRIAEDFNFTASTPQSSNTFSANFPRIGPKKLDLFIPSGQSGWMKVGADSNIGLTGVLFNFNAVRSQYAYNGGNNLQAVTLAGAVTLDIPLAVPVCR